MGPFSNPLQAAEQPIKDPPPPKWDDMANVWMDQLIKVVGAAPFLKAALDVITKLVAAILGVLIRSIGILGAWLANIWVKGEQQSDTAFAAAASVALEDLLDVKVPPSAFVGHGSGTGRDGAATQIGAVVMKSLFGEFGGQATGELKPSSKGAEQFISLMVKMSLEDWIQGWTMEAYSLGWMEKWGELGDNLSNTLGLGRLARQALSPIADVVMSTPLEWQVNKTYRPRLLSTAQAIRAFRAGKITQEEFREELARQGWTDRRMDALMIESTRELGVSDLDLLVSAGAWSKEAAVEHLQQAGWSPELAQVLMNIAEYKRTDQYRRSYAQVAADAFATRSIDQEEFLKILQGADLDEQEARWIHLVAGLKRELRVPELTESELEQAVLDGLRDLDDYRGYLLRKGFTPQDVQTKELMLIKRVQGIDAARRAKEAAAAKREEQEAERKRKEEERRAQIEAELAVREISLSQAERLVSDGVWSPEQYRALLISEKYTAADADALVASLVGRINDREEAELRRDALRKQAAVKKISISDLEESARRGLITVEEYGAALQEAGFAGDDAALMMELVADDIRRAVEREAEREAARERAAQRGISLEDLERSARRGIVTVDEYGEALKEAGFDDRSRAVLVAMLQGDIAADDAARKRRDDLEKAARLKKIPLAETRRAARRGIVPADAYAAQLADAGYSGSDIETMVALLRFEIAADVAAAAKRTAAAERLATRRISLDDLERAVLLGVVSIDVYGDALAREGFSAADAGILKVSLAQRVADAQAERKRRDAVSTTLKRRGLNLAQFERAVRSGLRTITEYAAMLIEQGYGQADVNTLVGLLNERVEADRAARAKRAAIDADLAARRISLADYERGVVEGERSLAEYVAFLRERGYPEEDISILRALLVEDIEVAREKAAAAAQKEV